MPFASGAWRSSSSGNKANGNYEYCPLTLRKASDSLRTAHINRGEDISMPLVSRLITAEFFLLRKSAICHCGAKCGHCTDAPGVVPVPPPSPNVDTTAANDVIQPTVTLTGAM